MEGISIRRLQTQAPVTMELLHKLEVTARVSELKDVEIQVVSLYNQSESLGYNVLLVKWNNNLMSIVHTSNSAPGEAQFDFRSLSASVAELRSVLTASGDKAREIGWGQLVDLIEIVVTALESIATEDQYANKFDIRLLGKEALDALGLDVPDEAFGAVRNV